MRATWRDAAPVVFLVPLLFGGATPYTRAFDGRGASASRNEFVAAPDSRYALLVGIDDYPGDESDLNGDVSDVMRMRQLLTTRFGFPEGNVRVLPDTEATRANIIAGFRQHLSKAGRNGVAVFYYSGHGTQVDTAMFHTSSFGSEPDGMDEALYVWGSSGRGSLILDDELGRLASDLGTIRTLIVLDACFSGTGTRAPSAQVKRALGSTIRKYLEPTPSLVQRRTGDTRKATSAAGTRIADVIPEPDHHTLLAASSDTETSLSLRQLPDSSGAGSLFTFYLVAALRTAPLTAPLSSVMTGVQQRVTRFAETTFEHAQTPQIEGTRKQTTLADLLRKP